MYWQSCVWKMFQIDTEKVENIEIFQLLTFLVILCGTYRDLDGPNFRTIFQAFLYAFCRKTL